MLNIISQQGNTSKNHNEIPLHTLEICILHTLDIITCVGDDVKKFSPSYIAGGNAKQCSCFGKQFLKKVTIEFSCKPAIPHSGIFSREIKTYIYVYEYS